MPDVRIKLERGDFRIEIATDSEMFSGVVNAVAYLLQGASELLSPIHLPRDSRLSRDTQPDKNTRRSRWNEVNERDDK